MINRSINGKTEVIGLIGNPVSHTISPQIQNTIADMLGVNVRYLPFHVLNEDVGDAVRGARALSIRGLNVTVPHKKAVVPFTCGLDPIAERAGAVNSLKLTDRGYLGYNTDVTGIIKTFKNRGVSVCGKKALIIGAGGSANAVCAALAECAAGEITVINRTYQTAKELAERVGVHYGINIGALSFSEWNKAYGYDMVVQTTVLGFGKEVGKSPVADMDVFKRAKFVFDLIYTPWETAFLKDAGKYCPLCANGFDMLVYQAIASFEIFMNVQITDSDSEAVRGELEKYFSKQL